jgi:hypothetical protein
MSHGTQSAQGSRFIDRIAATVATLEEQGRSVIGFFVSPVRRIAPLRSLRRFCPPQAGRRDERHGRSGSWDPLPPVNGYHPTLRKRTGFAPGRAPCAER